MWRTDAKASGESGLDFEKVVIVVAPGGKGTRPAHRDYPRREASLIQTPSRLPRRSTRCTLATILHHRLAPKPPVAGPPAGAFAGSSAPRSTERLQLRIGEA